MTRVRVRHFAAAADVAGCKEETVFLGPAAVLGDVAGALIERHGTRMAGLLRVAGFLQCGELTRDLRQAAASEVDVMPPFAGG